VRGSVCVWLLVCVCVPRVLVFLCVPCSCDHSFGRMFRTLGMCAEGKAQAKHYQAAVESAICRGAEAEAKYQGALKVNDEQQTLLEEAVEERQTLFRKFNLAVERGDDYQVKHQRLAEQSHDLRRECLALELRTENAERRVEVTEAKFQTILARCNTMIVQQEADAAARSALPRTPTATRKRARTADCECYKGPLRKSPLAAHEQMSI
jgi:hypothetical protein